MAQHARPNVAGHQLRARAHRTRSSMLAGQEVVLEAAEAVVGDVGDQAHQAASWPVGVGARHRRRRARDPRARHGGPSSVDVRCASIAEAAATSLLDRAPVERAVGDQVQERREHGDRELDDRDEPERAEPVEHGRERVEEDDLDVEDDEDHRDQVEAHREPLGRRRSGRRCRTRTAPSGPAVRRAGFRILDARRLIAANRPASTEHDDDRQVLPHAATCPCPPR